jgi:transcriptional regulator with XRE-family HTH domain
VEEIERRTIRVWMREVMQQKRLTANSWATLAGTSPTNITRFLNTDSKFMPSVRTLAKLAKIAGSSPQLLNKATETKHKIPVIDYKGKCVSMILFDRDDVVAYKCRQYTGMGSKGIGHNATVIVEPMDSFDECKDGDIIAYDSRTYGILCGEYRSGLIMFYPVDPHQMPQEFKKGFDGYRDWSAIPIESVGDERLFGKVIHAIVDFE